MVEISPEVPSSLLCFSVVPEPPGLVRFLIHVGHIVALIESSEVGVLAEISFTEVVSDCIGGDIGASNGKGDCENSSGPAVVVASVKDGKWGYLGEDSVVGPGEGFGIGNAEDGESLGAGLISFKGVTVVAGESACPVVLIRGEDRRLEGQALVEG